MFSSFEDNMHGRICDILVILSFYGFHYKITWLLDAAVDVVSPVLP
jgi:hypothetical protein